MYINSWRSTTLTWLSPASRLQRGSNLISQDYQLKSLWCNDSATYNHLSLTGVQQYTSVYVSKNVLFPHFTTKLGYLASATSAPAVSAGCDWNESDYSNNRRKCTEDVNFKLRCQINRFVLFTVSTATSHHVLLHFLLLQVYNWMFVWWQHRWRFPNGECAFQCGTFTFIIVLVRMLVKEFHMRLSQISRCLCVVLHIHMSIC